MSSNYLRGFASLTKETQNLVLPHSGETLPDWLNGSLIRNGPALYELPKYKLLHWLDGFAMLHRFEFQRGQVTYSNRFLRSQAYQQAMKRGELAFREYASQPHGGWLTRLHHVLTSKLSDNANVNVVEIGGRYMAITDVPNLVEFDPISLDTKGNFRFDDDHRAILGPSHPHYDYRRRATYSYFTSVRYTGGFEYKIYAVDEDSFSRRIIKTIRTKHPAYMHSFFMTENYIILPIYPWVLKNLPSIILKDRPLITNYTWQPSEGTTFLAVHKDTGEVKTWQAEAFAAFHTINAYEENGDITLDVSAYSDTGLVDTLFFDWLIAPGGGQSPVGEFRRYHLRQNNWQADYELIAGGVEIEMPRINYERSNAQTYRYAYGYNRYAGRPNDFYNQIVKVDLGTGRVSGWQKEHHYVGEPVFVPRPQGQSEDAGVLLSVVLDTTLDSFNQSRSYLLVLDAQDLREIATFELPHLMPLGLHGMHFQNVTSRPAVANYGLTLEANNFVPLEQPRSEELAMVNFQ